MGKNVIIKGADFSENAILQFFVIGAEAFNLGATDDTKESLDAYIVAGNTVVNRAFTGYMYRAFYNYELPFSANRAVVNVRAQNLAYVVFLDANLNIVQTLQVDYPSEQNVEVLFNVPVKYISASNEFNTCTNPQIVVYK